MPSQYVISKRSNGWAIVVDGSVLMVCERKKAAIQAVEDAIAQSAALADASSDSNCRAEPQAEIHTHAAAS